MLAKADSVEEMLLSDAERQQWSGYYGGNYASGKTRSINSSEGCSAATSLRPAESFWRTVLRREEEVRDFYSFNRPNFAPSFRAEIDRIVAEVGASTGVKTRLHSSGCPNQPELGLSSLVLQDFDDCEGDRILERILLEARPRSVSCPPVPVTR